MDSQNFTNCCKILRNQIHINILLNFLFLLKSLSFKHYYTFNLIFNNHIDFTFYLKMRNFFTNFIFSCYQFPIFLRNFIFMPPQIWFMGFKFDLLDSRSNFYLSVITKFQSFSTIMIYGTILY